MPTFASWEHQGRSPQKELNPYMPVNQGVRGNTQCTDHLQQHCPLPHILELTQNTKFREQPQPPAQAAAPAGVLGFPRVQSAGSSDGFVRSTRPQAAPARVLQVLLLQWRWQQPTWQAAACTHCSLLFVHCQGKRNSRKGRERRGKWKL